MKKKQKTDLLKTQEEKPYDVATQQTIDMYKQLRENIIKPKDGGFIKVDGKTHNLIGWKLKLTSACLGGSVSDRSTLTFKTDYLSKPGKILDISLYGANEMLTTAMWAKSWRVMEIHTEAHGSCDYICEEYVDVNEQQKRLLESYRQESLSSDLGDM